MEVTPEGILCFSIFLKHKTGHTSPLLKPFMFPIALALRLYTIWPLMTKQHGVNSLRDGAVGVWKRRAGVPGRVQSCREASLAGKFLDREGGGG